MSGASARPRLPRDVRAQRGDGRLSASSELSWSAPGTVANRNVTPGLRRAEAPTKSTSHHAAPHAGSGSHHDCMRRISSLLERLACGGSSLKLSCEERLDQSRPTWRARYK